ncbi:MAG: GntR family transcriptional regulator [Eubacteriales bacterium]
MTFKNEHIDKSTPVPMYYQLKNIILQKIESEVLKPGDLLPTEAEFIKIYNLSRTTVRQAILDLVNDGYLYRVKGKGTYVSKPKILQDFMRKLEPYGEQMKRLNLTPKTEVVFFDKMEATSDVAEALNIEVDDTIILLKRLRYANDEPIVFLETYLPESCIDILQEDMEKTGLYEYLSRSKRTKIIRVIRQIEAVGAHIEESEYLKIPQGYPIQMTTTTGYSEEGEPIEYSIAKYRGDKNKFIIELSV